MFTFYPIRHHGPGCARSLITALESQKPDLILIESPLETLALFQQAAHPDLKPPVAMLLYQSDDPTTSGFYPFARFSPEWNALRFAAKEGIPILPFDLPAAHSFALRNQESDNPEEPSEPPLEDPFQLFAQADGYTDGERWWNDKVEERNNSQDFFQAILEAVTALRKELARPETKTTLLREAYMRKTMRKAEKDNYQNIAVICGAWHAPALTERPTAKSDNDLLKGLPKVKVAATWTPWTNERLTFHSGYGAGIASPGWYDHLWSQPKFPMEKWLTRAARLLRKKDLEGSSASIIEATRLATSLAAMRGRPRPGLDESLEAMQTVFCQGDPAPLDLIREKLLTGTALGELPDSLPKLPLQQDLEAQQKSLRLKPTPGKKDLLLDLREDAGRRKSLFLHRLLALKLSWAEKKSISGKGTFKESWHLHWTPEVTLEIVDAALLGNTVATAAANALQRTEDPATLSDLTTRLDLALLSDLPEATSKLLHQLDHTAATTGDLRELLGGLIALLRIARYGDVRDTDTQAVQRLLSPLALRAHLDLPRSAANLDDDAASDLSQLLTRYATALQTFTEEKPTLQPAFHQALKKLTSHGHAHPLLCGLATRLLREAQELDPDQFATALSHALSPGNPPPDSARWLEGFLTAQGSLLAHDPALLSLIHNWLGTIPEEQFQDTLPLLRRTFGTFTTPERTQIAQTIQRGQFEQREKPTLTPETHYPIPELPPALTTVRHLLFPQ